MRLYKMIWNSRFIPLYIVGCHTKFNANYAQLPCCYGNWHWVQISISKSLNFLQISHYTNDARLQVKHSNILFRSWHVITRVQGQHIWMFHEQPCFICFVAWPTTSKYKIQMNNMFTFIFLPKSRNRNSLCNCYKFGYHITTILVHIANGQFWVFVFNQFSYLFLF